MCCDYFGAEVFSFQVAHLLNSIKLLTVCSNAFTFARAVAGVDALQLYIYDLSTSNMESRRLYLWLVISSQMTPVVNGLVM